MQGLGQQWHEGVRYSIFILLPAHNTGSIFEKFQGTGDKELDIEETNSVNLSIKFIETKKHLH